MVTLLMKNPVLADYKSAYWTSHLSDEKLKQMLCRLFTHKKKYGFLMKPGTSYKLFLFHEGRGVISCHLSYKNGKEIKEEHGYLHNKFMAFSPDYKEKYLATLNSAFNDYKFYVGEEGRGWRLNANEQELLMQAHANCVIVVSAIPDARLLDDFKVLAENTANRYATHKFLLRNEFNPEIKKWVRVFELLGEPKAGASDEKKDGGWPGDIQFYNGERGWNTSYDMY